MPTDPAIPNSSASVDRLALGIDSPRGAQPSMIPGGCMCFDAEASNYGNMPTCFEAEASSVGGLTICAVCTCACIETE